MANHYTGSDLPAYATATAFIIGTDDERATIYSDVGLTTPIRNPFVLVNGAYDFYTADADTVYVAIGVDRAVYESSDGEPVEVDDGPVIDRDEYLAPSAFPGSTAGGSGITSLTGDVTAGPGSGAQVATLATSGVAAGAYTNADITVDAKGRVTVAANGASGSGTVTHTSGALTANSLVIGNGADDIKVTTTGTGIVTALGVNVGSAGAPVTFNGAGGTPSSLTLTNATGLPLTTGVTGVLPGANGGGLVLLADTTLGSDTASFDFTSISGSYKHLMIVVQGQSTVVATNDNVKMTFNNDTAANYDYVQWAMGSGGAVPASVAEGYGQTSIVRIMTVPGASSSAGDVGNATIYIPSYAGTTFNKSASSMGGALLARSSTNARFTQGFGAWRSTAAITRVTLTMTSGSWKTGSQATLYGMN